MSNTPVSRTETAFEDRLHAPALATAGAIIAAAIMLLLGLLANLGVYEGAAAAMMEWHMFFSLSAVGIVGGMLEAAIITFVFLYVFSWMYNAISGRAVSTDE